MDEAIFLAESQLVWKRSSRARCATRTLSKKPNSPKNDRRNVLRYSRKPDSKYTWNILQNPAVNMHEYDTLYNVSTPRCGSRVLCTPSSRSTLGGVFNLCPVPAFDLTQLENCRAGWMPCRILWCPSDCVHIRGYKVPYFRFGSVVYAQYGKIKTKHAAEHPPVRLKHMLQTGRAEAKNTVITILE